MARERFDVFISGGGIAGLCAAAAFAEAGLSVCLADPAPPPDSAEAEGSDLRSTAFLQPARALLERVGLWALLADRATPLEVLRVMDSAGDPPQVTAAREFRADELSEAPFGWNLPNWLTRKVLVEALRDAPGVTLRLGVGFGDMLVRDREALIGLSDGTRIGARLAVGADGRGSPLRAAAGIGVAVTRYGQKALAFSVTHAVPHDNVSTEIYRDGGAFTLVPLPDHDGRPASAVVWMNDGARAVELAGMEAGAFNAEMTARSCGVLGALELATPRRVWPVVTQRAERLTAARVALVAEAAHVLPPIGAQGLNTSLADVAALVELAREMPDHLGAPAMLDRYARARERDIRARAGVIDLFNRVCKSRDPAVQAIRTAGLKAVYDLPPLRRGVMRAGLGSGGR